MSVYKPANRAWTYTYTDYAASPPQRRTRTAPTKAIARAREQLMKARMEEVRQGIITAGEAKAAEYAGKSLSGQLPDYLADLKSAGRSAGHVASTKARLTKLLRVAPFRLPSEVTHEGVRKALEAYKAEPLPRAGGCKPQQHAANKAAGALKAYLQWMVENKRLGTSPLAGRLKLPKVTEAVHPRRSTTSTSSGWRRS
jgi:hypothetical protein